MLLLNGLANLELGSDEFLELFGAQALWPFDGKTEDTIPDEGREDTDSTRNTKEYSVEVLLGEAIVLEQNTTVSIDVWPGVLGLALLEKDRRDNLTRVENSSQVREVTS